MGADIGRLNFLFLDTGIFQTFYKSFGRQIGNLAKSGVKLGTDAVKAGVDIGEDALKAGGDALKGAGNLLKDAGGLFKSNKDK